MASGRYWVSSSSASSDWWIHAVKSVYGLKVIHSIKELQNVEKIKKTDHNRPFPSCFEPHYESEASCIVFIMKISFIHMQTSNFHMKSSALSLAFAIPFKAPRKLPIDLLSAEKGAESFKSDEQT